MIVRHSKPLTLLAMCLGLFIPQLDTTVVNLALPGIGHSLHLDVSGLQWIIDSYNLIFASLLLLGGILGDRFGRKRLFVSGLALFTLGSLLCGFATALPTLLMGRVLQGVGAALELPGTLSILTLTYTDAHQRARAMGIWASVAGVALAVGPTAGALLVTVLGWQSIFYMNVPIGLFALVLAGVAVRESSDPCARRLDLLAQLLAVLFLFALTYAMIESQTRGWASPPILGGLGLAFGCLIAFIVAQRRAADAMVPLAVFRHPAFSAALAMAAMMTFGMYGMLFLLSLYMQSLTHATALTAGLELTPLSLAFIIVSHLAGRLVRRIGPRRLTAAGMALMGSGLLLLLLLTPGQSISFLLLVMSIIGIGLGFNMGPVLTVAMGSIPPERSGVASGLSNVARMVGATLGVALLGALFARHFSHGQTSAAFLAGLHADFFAGAGAELLGALLALRHMPGSVGEILRPRAGQSAREAIDCVRNAPEPAPEICLLETRVCS